MLPCAVPCIALRSLAWAQHVLASMYLCAVGNCSPRAALCWSGERDASADHRSGYQSQPSTKVLTRQVMEAIAELCALVWVCSLPQCMAHRRLSATVTTKGYMKNPEFKLIAHHLQNTLRVAMAIPSSTLNQILSHQCLESHHSSGPPPAAIVSWSHGRQASLQE